LGIIRESVWPIVDYQDGCYPCIVNGFDCPVTTNILVDDIDRVIVSMMEPTSSGYGYDTYNYTIEPYPESHHV